MGTGVQHSGVARFESRPETQVILNEIFLTFPQSIQENTGIVSRLVQNRVLPNPFQFTIHQLSCYILAFDSLQGKKFFSSLQRPDRLWGPLSLLVNGTASKAARA
jgi:hypothetical protein